MAQRAATPINFAFEFVRRLFARRRLGTPARVIGPSVSRGALGPETAAWPAVRLGLAAIVGLVGVAGVSPGLAQAAHRSSLRVSARYRVNGHAVTVTGSIGRNTPSGVLRRSRWHVVLEQRVKGTQTHKARHAQWVVRARGRLHTGPSRRFSSYRLQWTAGGAKRNVMLRVRVVAGGHTIATSHPRDVRLHVAASPRGAPPTPVPTTTPAPTTTTPAPTTTPPPATSITVDTASPGEAINPGGLRQRLPGAVRRDGQLRRRLRCVLAVVHHAADLRGGRGITALPRWDHRSELPVDAGDRTAIPAE